MSNINLKRFVNINIVQHVTSVVSGTRDTVVLYTAEKTDGFPHLISSFDEAKQIYADKAMTLAYLQIYFSNGGVKAYVIENVQHENLTNEMLLNLDNKYICIAYANPNAFNSLKALAIERAASSNVYGINEKLIIASTIDYFAPNPVKNFIAKVGGHVPGIEMTIAAYLSKINVYGIDTIHDYAFTQEFVPEEALTTLDSEYELSIQNNYNVDVRLANAVRNCGGNCTDGADIVNTFVRIILHQTLTERLIELLTQKIKSTSGISKIYTVIANELEKYLTCGYLTTDKVWTDEDLKISYNQTSYTIIEKGTALTSGYVVRILPMSSLTDEDKALRKAPPIYIVLADQYGIRQITINGEVI